MNKLPINKYEILFYVAAAFGVITNEIGWGPCTFLPSMILVAIFGYLAYLPRQA